MDLQSIHTEADAFTCFDSWLKTDHNITEAELVTIGKGLSGKFIQSIEGVFSSLGFVNNAVKNYFSNRAIEVIQKYNWQVVNDHFHPKKEEENTLKNMIPSQSLLLSNSDKYKEIQKWHNYYSIKQEVDSLRKEGKESQWLESLAQFGDIEWELEELVEGESFSCINDLNQICKENKTWLTQTDFGLLVKSRMADRPLKEITPEDVKSIRETIEFFNSNDFLIEKLSDGQFSGVLHIIYEKLKTLFSEIKPSSNKEAFIQFCKERDHLFGNSPKEVGEALDESYQAFHKERLDFLTNKSNLLINSLTKYKLDSLVRDPLNQHLKNANLTQKVQTFPIDPEKLLAKLLSLEESYNKFASLGMKDTFTLLVHEEVKKIISNKTPLETAIDRVSKKMEAFTICLPEKITPKQMEKIVKLYEFYTDVVNKNIYSPEVVVKALKELIEKQGLEKVVGGAIGGLGSRLSMTFFSDEEKEFLKVCFKLQAQQIAEEAYANKKIPMGEDIQKLSDEIVSLFIHTDVLTKKNSLIYFSHLIAFAAELSIQKYPISSIKLAISLKKQELHQLDLEKINNQTQPQLSDRLKQEIKAEVVKHAEKHLSPTKNFENLAIAVQNDPIRLVSTLGSAFIEKILPNSSIESQREISQALQSFAPILNPLMKDSKFIKDLQEKPKDQTILNILLSLLSNVSRDALDPAVGLVKTLVKEQIRYKSDTGMEGPIQSLVNNILEANELYRKTKGKQVNFEELPIPALQKWLLTGLQDLSEKSPWISTLGRMVPNFIQETSAFTGFIGGKVLQAVTSYLLWGSEEITSEEKEKIVKSVDTLAKVLLPILPELKKNHDIEFYSNFINKLNAMVHSDKPIEGEEVAEKIKAVLTHFLDKELDYYKEPLHAALKSIPQILD